MKISELIHCLTLASETVGDIEVDVFTGDGLVLEATSLRYVNEECGEFITIVADKVVGLG